MADALGSDVIEPPPPMDFAAVTRILAPITESLNEKADEAMFPSPPDNTPLVGSPTRSGTWAPPTHSFSRGRGFSDVRDRLSKLKMEGRRARRHHDHGDTDVTSSTRSAEPSVAEECDECDVASISEVMSEACKDKNCPDHASTCLSSPVPSPMGTGSVPIALGSPMINPRIEEYLSFTSKDLPSQAPAPATGTTLAQHAESTSTTALGANRMHSRISFKSDGVTEKSNWAEELEDTLEHTCLRLEQLAYDEHTADPTKTAEEYYVARMRRFFASGKRQIPVHIAGGTQDD
ncbi:hypothetical protein ACEQ8H_003632 [Pleosporales sp. CAS-2024a]